MSADSSNAFERYNLMPGGGEYLQGYYLMTPDSDGEYVRYDDYAKLEQQRAALVDHVTALVEALKAMLGRTQEDCGRIFVPNDAAVRAAFAALKAAGVSA